MSGQGPACRTPPWWQSSPEHEQRTQQTSLHKHFSCTLQGTHAAHSHCLMRKWDVLCCFKQSKPFCSAHWPAHLAAVVASLEPVANDDLSLGVCLLHGGHRVPAVQTAAGMLGFDPDSNCFGLPHFTACFTRLSVRLSCCPASTTTTTTHVQDFTTTVLIRAPGRASNTQTHARNLTHTHRTTPHHHPPCMPSPPTSKLTARQCQTS